MANIITTSAADNIASRLVTLGHGTIATNLFVNKEPSTPDACVTVYDTGYWKPPEIDYCWEYPNVQVRVRKAIGGTQAAKLFALTLMNALHGYTGTIGSVRYAGVFITSGPIPLGEDESNRPIWVFNCQIQRTTTA